MYSVSQTKLTIALAVSSLLILGNTTAQILITENSLNSGYVESFENLTGEGDGSWEDNVTVTGWHANQETLSAIRAASERTPVPGLYNLGSRQAGGSADRALGGVASLKEPLRIALRLRNDTGKEITSCDLSFMVKQFRSGDLSNRIEVSARVFPAGGGDLLDDSGWEILNACEFLNDTEGNEALNPVPSYERSTTLSNLQWKPGEELWIRWGFSKQRGNGVPLGLDDVRVYNFSTR